MIKNKKIGRNENCPCNSGKKFKHCHGGINAGPAPLPFNPELLDKEIKRKIEETKARQKLQEEQQGLGRAIVSTMTDQGYRIVAVGNKIFWSQKWQTFHDFLMEYIRSAIDSNGWGNEEIKKPYDDRHPILQWYHQICVYQKETIKVPGQVYSAVMTGVVEAYIHLAYNLYLLAHNKENNKFNEKVLNRLAKKLRNKETFPGAYYETYVYAMLIKAGFDIEFEDENAPGSHCECTAICRKTGNKYSVEAKAIKREGALGAKGNATSKPLEGSVKDQLYKALKKTAAHPRIVFIDVNLPHTEDGKFPKWIDEAVAAAKAAEGTITIDKQPAPPAYVFFTNHPHHYHQDKVNYGRAAVGIGYKIPDFGHGQAYPGLRAKYQAKKKHSAVHRLLNSMKVHYDIPSTFEPGYAEFAFNDPSIPRLIIGNNYFVPDADGREVIGELEDAIVLENEKSVMGIYHIKEKNIRITAKCPMTDIELAAYKKHPDTFFGVIRQVGSRIDDPFELFEWMLETYIKTSKEKLLEFMNEHSDYESLKLLSQEELAEIYCEGCAYAILADKNKPT